MTMICYLAGPMSSVPEFNFPRFFEVAARLRAIGHVVFSPAEHDLECWPRMREWPGFAAGDQTMCPEFSRAKSMRWDVARIAESDAIVFLPGWEKSGGSRFELSVATQCGVDVLYASRATGVWEIIEP